MVSFAASLFLARKAFSAGLTLDDAKTGFIRALKCSAVRSFSIGAKRVISLLHYACDDCTRAEELKLLSLSMGDNSHTENLNGARRL